jgi:hypothetical protein
VTRILTLAALATVLAAACSPSDEVVSTTDDPARAATSTLAATTTSTADTTTASVADATTTTVPATTTLAPTTTTAAAATSTTTAAPATSTTVAGPAPTPPAVAYASGEAALVELDAATGEVTRTLAELFNGDGVFRGSLRLAPDGATLWFTEGYEDGWYACETSIGSFGRVDVATGALEIVGVGSGVEPSPDGALVAYLTSDQCLPDPENPDLWVLTPYDRVVVRDVAAGTEQEIVTEPAPTEPDAPSRIEWAGFAPDGGLLVRTADGDVRRVDPAGPPVLQDHPVVLSDVRGSPAGTTAGALITVDLGDEGSADLYAVDLDSGGATLLASSEGFVTAGVAANGAIVAAGFGEIEVEPGAPVTVLDGTYYDIDW